MPQLQATHGYSQRQREHSYSQRRACRLIQGNRSTARHSSTRADDDQLRQRLKAVAQEQQRWRRSSSGGAGAAAVAQEQQRWRRSSSGGATACSARRCARRASW